MRKTKLTVKPTTAFKKDYKLAIKRGLQIELLETVIETLAMGNALPPENRDHDLTGNWRGHRECHIQPDWLLIYRIEGDVLVLTLSRTGTHSDLFALTAIRKGDGMAGFINIAIVAACSARCLSPSTKETEKCQTLLLIFFITTTVAPYLSSKWLRYSFHHYYGTQDRFGQISPSLSTTTGMCGLPKMGAKKTPRTFKKSVALQLGRYSIFISIM